MRCDITGKRFGKLVAIEPVGKDKRNNCTWIPMSEQYKNKQSNCNKMRLPKPYKGEEK